MCRVHFVLCTTKSTKYTKVSENDNPDSELLALRVLRGENIFTVNPEEPSAKIAKVKIRHYLAASGKDPYPQWLDGLLDLTGRVAIQRRMDRLVNGNSGDHKFCQQGVWELRIDFGPGYRVYYAQDGESLVVLLCGGSKQKQSSDIKDAVRHWLDYQRRKP